MACVRVIKTNKRYSNVTHNDNTLAIVNQVAVESTVSLLDLRTGEIHTTIDLGKNFRTPALSPIAPLLALTRDCCSDVYVWDYTTGQNVAVLRGHIYPVARLVFSPDGRLLASGSYDDTIRVWRTDDWTAPPTVLTNGYMVFSQDSRLMASYLFDSVLHLWNITPNLEVTSAGLREVRDVLRVAIHSQLVAAICGPIILINRATINIFSIVNNRIGKLVRTLDHTSAHVFNLAFSPCGRQLASGADDGSVWLWDIRTGACTHKLNCSNNVQRIAYTPQGLTTTTYDGVIRTWLCPGWSDRTHRLSSPDLKRRVFQLMCVRARLSVDNKMKNIPIELWLMVMAHLSLCAEPVIVDDSLAVIEDYSI